MDNFIQGAIKHLKQNYDGSYKNTMIKYFSERTCTPEQHYTDSILESMMKQIFCGYISESYFVLRDMTDFFHYLENTKNIFEAICITLSLVQVRKDTRYVSGFTEDYENA